MVKSKLFPFNSLVLIATLALHAPRTAKAEATTGAAPAPAVAPTADQIVARIVENDSWGLGGAEVTARAVVTERSGKNRALAFETRSRRHAPPLTKSVITFRAPADIAGMKFLQIQRSSEDDDRFLYTPELKRSRRIAGANRSESFMGTDFSFADLDGRDLRKSKARLDADDKVGRFDCYHLHVTPTNDDAVYGKIELWVRKDNMVPLKWIMFDRRGALAKTLIARELQRLSGKWFITSSRMTDQATGRSTELLLEKIDRRDDIPEALFSVRGLEKG